jgi:hypothetical protein
LKLDMRAAFPIAWLLLAAPLAAQTAIVTDSPAAPGREARRTLQVAPVPAVLPSVDGRLDDAAWAGAMVATDFVQQRPNPGQPASQRTEARVLVAGGAVYVAMRMYDTAPDLIATQLARRDASGLNSDWAQVVIDSYHDRRTAFRFAVNPSGVKRDILHFNDTDEDLGWDAVWEAATSVDSLGWTAEFRIPLSQLRYRVPADGDEATWGINFMREIARNGERSWWTPIRPDAGGFVSQFGELAGLQGLRQMRRLEVIPYSVARLTRAPEGQPGNPFYSTNDLWGAMGADVRYGLTSDLTLTATINPDFGQVEADPSEVNLSAFESFFAERRPFFQEGADIFRFNIGLGDGSSEQLFYSRRIGRAPQRGVSVRDGHVNAPEAARILGAAKVSGKAPGGWSVGFLNATTGAAHAQIDSLGMRWSTPVEPLTNYAVARLSRDFREGQSTVGGILTSTHRDLGDESLGFLNRAAYAGGLDLRHRFGGGNYRVAASLLGSRIEGSEQAILRAQRSSVRYFQRPDADHVELDPTRTSLQGTAGNFELMKTGGGHWRWGLFGMFRTPGFEINDAGFQVEGDQMIYAVYAGYDQFQPQGPFRRWRLNVNQWAGQSFGSERLGVGGNVNGSFQLRNFWEGFGGLNRNQESISTWALRGGPSIVRPGRTNLWGGFNSDNRKRVVANIFVNASREDDTGASNLSFNPGVQFRPAGNVSLSVSPGLSWNQSAWQCAAPPSCRVGERYLFGQLDQRIVSLTTRLNYTFTPNLSLQFYAQPFLSAQRYSEFREVRDPQAKRFDDRFHTYTAEQVRLNPQTGRYEVRLDGQGTPDFAFGDPSFSFRQLRTNTVLRWEYRPGSTLFVVWSQGRTAFDADGTFRLRHDTSELFTAEPTNVLLVKFNYWLSL